MKVRGWGQRAGGPSDPEHLYGVINVWYPGFRAEAALREISVLAAGRSVSPLLQKSQWSHVLCAITCVEPGFESTPPTLLCAGRGAKALEVRQDPTLPEHVRRKSDVCKDPGSRRLIKSKLVLKGALRGDLY